MLINKPIKSEFQKAHQRPLELTQLIDRLMQGHSLSLSETQAAMEHILSGANQEQIAAFLVLLHAKGETAEECQGLLQAMQSKMKAVTLDFPVLDIVGTGGDHTNTVNISTASSVLAAACGAKVVKHGNRSVSSHCGSADVLEALGMTLARTPNQIRNDVNRHGFAFCFAPYFHPAMTVLKPIRKALGVRTSINLMGPLLNPAHAQHLLVGVFSPDYLDLYADMVLKLGITHAMVVHSCGLDELSVLGPSQVVEIRDGKKQFKLLDPKKFNFEYSPLKALQGSSIEENTILIKQALQGKPGPIADTIVLNTGAALYVADLVDCIEEGIALASKKIKTGEALKVIE